MVLRQLLVAKERWAGEGEYMTLKTKSCPDLPKRTTREQRGVLRSPNEC